MVKFLIDQGASTDVRNKTGKTTLAGAQGPVVDYLRGLGMAQ